ncbi:MAG: DegT/DnrJ/EryC1/StrS family aminotransferase [Caldilineaceae bacterium]|jgi:perosamine synthetase|nr:DegT/DnrJ/EryC1/StrS family aminotransferase [Caldilineaceae bacterium]
MIQQLSLFPYLETQESERPPDFIPVYTPVLDGREEKYVLDAVRSGWISSLGSYVARFEQDFARFCGVRHAVSVSNGTVALHLALHALGIGPGDEVIAPSLTFIATANAVQYTGATPVFADVDAVTWCIDPHDVRKRITPRTRAILPVHLYGHPAPMRELQALADEQGLWLVEDAAEAHGAAIDGRCVGGWGRVATFSFYANKVITTGEGGMVTTDDDALAARCRMLRDHAMPPHRRYWHDEVGFNYRMTNLQAAVGVAQMERIHHFIRRKREIAARYREGLADISGITFAAEQPGYTNIYWMASLLVDPPFALTRDDLIPALRAHGIDSRPFFHPLDALPPYCSDAPRPVALHLSRCGLNLPSSPSLTDDQVAYICGIIRSLGA